MTYRTSHPGEPRPALDGPAGNWIGVAAFPRHGARSKPLSTEHGDQEVFDRLFRDCPVDGPVHGSGYSRDRSDVHLKYKNSIIPSGAENTRSARS